MEGQSRAEGPESPQETRKSRTIILGALREKLQESDTFGMLDALANLAAQDPEGEQASTRQFLEAFGRKRNVQAGLAERMLEAHLAQDLGTVYLHRKLARRLGIEETPLFQKISAFMEKPNKLPPPPAKHPGREPPFFLRPRR